MAKKKSFDLSDITGLGELDFPGTGFFETPKSSRKPTAIVDKANKHDEAYQAFIRWSGTPSKLRDPKTIKEFESVWKLPKRYASNEFKRRSDYHERKMKFFWTWMFDKFPDVIYAVYRRAITNSTADARIFADIVGKKLETEAPKARMTPFVMVGIPQEKINDLFIPESYEEAEVVDADSTK